MADFKSRESWVGNADRFGILQRLGITLMVMSFALVVLGCNAPGNASIRYALFVAAHLVLYSGFVLAAAGDLVAKRPFSSSRFVYTAVMGTSYGILGPVAMSAAAAASRNYR